LWIVCCTPPIAFVYVSFVLRVEYSKEWYKTGVPIVGYMYPKWYICLSEGVHLRLAIEWEKISLYIIHFKLFIHINLSEPFHVTNGDRQGRVLSLQGRVLIFR